MTNVPTPPIYPPVATCSRARRCSSRRPPELASASRPRSDVPRKAPASSSATFTNAALQRVARNSSDRSRTPSSATSPTKTTCSALVGESGRVRRRPARRARQQRRPRRYGDASTEMTDEQWSSVLDVTLTGTMRMTRAALRQMCDTRRRRDREQRIGRRLARPGRPVALRGRESGRHGAHALRRDRSRRAQRAGQCRRAVTRDAPDSSPRSRPRSCSPSWRRARRSAAPPSPGRSRTSSCSLRATWRRT